MTRAVFLDRDGVVNELVYYEGHGTVDSPFTVEQFRLLPGVMEELNARPDGVARDLVEATGTILGQGEQP